MGVLRTAFNAGTISTGRPRCPAVGEDLSHLSAQSPGTQHICSQLLYLPIVSHLPVSVQLKYLFTSKQGPGACLVEKVFVCTD